MLVVEPGAGHGGDEKLRPVGIGPGIGHAERKRAVVAQVAVELVFEFASPNRLAARPIAQRVSHLHHEARNHPVHDGAVVVAVAGVHLGVGELVH